MSDRMHACMHTRTHARRERCKDSCPDLGVLLAKLLLVPRSTAPWATFAPLFVRELLARQVSMTSWAAPLCA